MIINLKPVAKMEQSFVPWINDNFRALQTALQGIPDAVDLTSVITDLTARIVALEAGGGGGSGPLIESGDNTGSFISGDTIAISGVSFTAGFTTAPRVVATLEFLGGSLRRMELYLFGPPSASGFVYFVATTDGLPYTIGPGYSGDFKIHWVAVEV